MADIDQPLRAPAPDTHLTAQMHRSEDDAGDPIPDGWLLGADGARGHRWFDPSDFGGGPPASGGFVPTYVPPATTFAVPDNSQALFVLPIVLGAGAGISIGSNSALVEVD